MTIMKICAVAILLCGTLLSGGCATYPGGKVPTVTDSELKSIASSSGINYSLDGGQVVPEMREEELSAIVKETFQECGLKVDSRPATHLDIKVTAKENVPLIILSSLISGATFTVLMTNGNIAGRYAKMSGGLARIKYWMNLNGRLRILKTSEKLLLQHSL